MSNRNRDAGNAWERECINRMKDLGYDAVSSRQESRAADASGIDIISESFPLKPQCKKQKNQPNIHTLLTETEAEVIFYQKVEKRGKRFYSVGEYVMLSMDDFFKLIK